MAREILGRYELTQALGHGGMGEVWAAHDRQLDRRVAVKFLAPRGQGGALTVLEQRFLREARLTARLEHTGVPVIHDLGKLDDGQLYLVMELVPGHTLSELVRRDGRLPVPRAAGVLAQTADALAYAHGKGVVHRDLKPSNLMLTPDGTVKVLDFGIAAALQQGPDDTRGPEDRRGRDEQRLTGTHATPGTPGFMAPEQAAGRTTELSDLYALGCVLYELLAGVPPLTAPNGIMLLYRHMRDEVPPLAGHRPDAPVRLTDLVMRLLAKDPRDRPSSAAEVRDLARAWTARPAGQEPAGRRPDVRHTDGQADDQAAESPRPARPGAGALPSAVADARSVPRPRVAAASNRRPPADSAASNDSVITTQLEFFEQVRRDGEPSRAHDGFVSLEAELRRSRPDADRDLHVLACRTGKARCLAALGRTPEALHEFETLLPVQRSALGPADPAVLRTREEIAVLVARAGDHTRAHELLVRLSDDLRHALPESDDGLARVGRLITRLERLLGTATP